MHGLVEVILIFIFGVLLPVGSFVLCLTMLIKVFFHKGKINSENKKKLNKKKDYKNNHKNKYEKSFKEFSKKIKDMVEENSNYKDLSKEKKPEKIKDNYNSNDSIYFENSKDEEKIKITKSEVEEAFLGKEENSKYELSFDFNENSLVDMVIYNEIFDKPKSIR